jgi:hypothetical protein
LPSAFPCSPRGTTEHPPLALVGPHLLPDSRSGLQAKGEAVKEAEQRRRESRNRAPNLICAPWCLSSGSLRSPGLSACDGWGSVLFSDTPSWQQCTSLFPLRLASGFCNPILPIDAHRACARAVKEKTRKQRGKIRRRVIHNLIWHPVPPYCSSLPLSLTPLAYPPKLFAARQAPGELECP